MSTSTQSHVPHRQSCGDLQTQRADAHAATPALYAHRHLLGSAKLCDAIHRQHRDHLFIVMSDVVVSQCNCCLVKQRFGQEYVANQCSSFAVACGISNKLQRPQLSAPSEFYSLQSLHRSASQPPRGTRHAYQDRHCTSFAERLIPLSIQGANDCECMRAFYISIGL